jgi:hypothetical protein
MDLSRNLRPYIDDPHRIGRDTLEMAFGMYLDIETEGTYDMGSLWKGRNIT